MIALRKILALVFTVAFLALCPALVLHVLKIMRTGIIKMDSQPKTASVTLDGRDIGGATPLIIPDLPPGTYEMTVSAPGYQSWSQAVTVNQGRATTLERVLLLPDKPRVRNLTDAGFDRLISIERMPFLLLTDGDSAGALRVFDTRNSTLRPLLPADSPMAAGRVEDIFIAARSSRVICHIELNDEPGILLVDVATVPHRIDDLSERFSEPAGKVLWDESAKEVLFSFRDGKVRKIDLRLGRDDSNFGGDWRGIGVFNRRVHYMERDGRIKSMAFDKSSEKTIFDDPRASREIFGESATYAIWPLDAETILFHSDNGRLCQSGLPNVLVEEGVRGVRSDEDSSRVLVWTARRLGVLETSSDKTRGTGPFEKGRQVTWIFENAGDIRDAWCVDGGSHAVVQDGGRLVLLELFAGVNARPRGIAGAKPASGVRYDARSGLVHALEPERGRLIGIEIAPPRSLLAPQPSRKSP
jgi:hypothetical protein